MHKESFSYIERNENMFINIYYLVQRETKFIVSTLINKNGSSRVLSSPRNARDASACAAHTDAERDGYSG